MCEDLSIERVHSLQISLELYIQWRFQPGTMIFSLLRIHFLEKTFKLSLHNRKSVRKL